MPITVSRGRKLAIGTSLFDGAAFKRQVIAGVVAAVNASATKALESAIEDAPVRDVFKHGSAYRRKGLRTRRLTSEEAVSENAIRKRLKYINKDGDLVTMAPAIAGVTRTRGRGFGGPKPLVRPKSGRNAYLRRAATRKGNPNAFDPFVLDTGGVLEDKDRLTSTRGRESDKRLRFEGVRGGRIVVSNNKGQNVLAAFPDALKSRKDGGSGYEHSPLHARGRFELRTGRSLFKRRDTGETTLGGRLRGEIEMIPAVPSDKRIKAKVVSPTYYAKYQEFGTRHNRATPYMRPAILKQVTTFRRDVVKSINRMSKSTPEPFGPTWG